MAETTGIAWCNSTFNPWIGCTRVSPGCDSCYAEALDRRHRWQGVTHWGVAQPRMRTSEAYWKQPLRWNRLAETQTGTSGRWLVFCSSLADVFDNEVPEQWRADLFDLIYDTPNLTWLLLTKRIGNAHRMMPWSKPISNVWLGASIVHQEEADRDIPKLLATPATKRFVSYEPALGPVDFSPWLSEYPEDDDGAPYPGRLDWIIVGGESSQGRNVARTFSVEWARNTIEQCRAAGVAVFVKQIGSSPIFPKGDSPKCVFSSRAGADPDEWPVDLRVREFPR